MLMFVLTLAVALTVVPWYGLTRGFHAGAWVWFVVILSANELAITCGYHRLFAHYTYEARPALKIVYLLFGAMALQNSALLWSAGHRTHHRYIDDPQKDPDRARLLVFAHRLDAAQLSERRSGLERERAICSAILWSCGSTAIMCR